MNLEYVEFVSGEKYPADRQNLNLSDDLNDFDSAGLMIPKDVVVVDIDSLDNEQIDKMIETFDITTRYYRTDRGIHLYYKKPKRHRRSSEHICLLGFNVEFKDNQSAPFITIKLDGNVFRDFQNTDNELEELPDYFKPQKTLESLLGLNDGEGRYNKLVYYGMRLKDNSRKHLILNYINDYILGEKMSEKNFNNILNAKSNKTEVDLSSAQGMVRHVLNQVKPAKYYNHDYWLIDNNYTGDMNKWHRYILGENQSMSSSMVEEVVKLVGMQCPYYDEYTEWTIKLPNGVLNKGKFINIDSFTEFTPFTLPYPYIEDAKCPPALEKFMKTITDGDLTYYAYLMDMLAWSLIINPEIRKKHPKVHIIVGDGGNGKGVLMGLMREVLGQNNCSTVKMDELKDEKKLVTLRSSLANLGEDIKDKPMDKDIFSVLKNVTALDPITVRDMYEKAQGNVMIHSNLIFTSNHLVQAFERGASVERRVVWCPMYGQVGSELTDEEFDELKSEDSFIFLTKLMVEHYMRLYDTREFTVCQKVIDFTKQTIDSDDTLGTYLMELKFPEFIDNKPADVFNNYCTYCESEGIENNIKQKKFITELNKLRGTINKPTKVNGKSTRVLRPDLSTEKGRKLQKELEKLGTE